MLALCDGLAGPVLNPTLLKSFYTGTVPPHPIPNDFRVLPPKSLVGNKGSWGVAQI